VTVVGRAEQDDGEPLLLRRNSAREGDAVAVTDTLGDSAAGLRRLQEGAEHGDPLVQAHLRPKPRLAEGAMAVLAGITCGIDISDGLVQDLGHVCKASGVGAVLRAADLPLSDELREAYPDDAVTLACTGGEDYELLLIGPRERLEEINAETGRRQVTFIGEIVKDYDRSVKVLDEAGKPIRFERTGWDAFRS
jgi:thiamine-monophosphate kinase